MPAEELTIQPLAGRDGLRILRITGPIVLQSIFPFQSALRAETADVLILDMAAVPHVDSAGIGTLVLTHVSRQNAGRVFALAGVNERVRTVLQVTRVEQVLTTFPTLAEAETALAGKRMDARPAI